MKIRVLPKMLRFKIIFLLLFTSIVFANGLKLDNKQEFYDLLPHSQVFIDKERKFTIKDALNNKIKFENTNQKLLGFGYSPNFDVWVKFTLENTTDKPLYKVLEYKNTLTTDILFFSPENNYEAVNEGLFHIDEKRRTINPTFKITLNPYEKKTYYIKASSYITTLIVKLNIWNSDTFYKQEIKHQVILGLFFGAMIILALYNLFIYFYTHDHSYLFYVLYIFGIVVHHLIYVGIANVYFIPQDMIPNVISYASLIVGFPTLALALFTKHFLHTKQYPIFNKLLNTYLILFPFMLSIFLITDEFNKYRNIFTVLLLVLLITLTVYAVYKKNRQAYFVLFGWFIFLTAGLGMYLSSAGVFNIYNTFPYYVELSLVMEAIVFSIALADRIKKLQEDKAEANRLLISQQQNEKKRLQVKVEEKTKDLQIALDEKGLLLKELNHRVKNNMQTIVSLINLQTDDIKDESIKDIFTTIQNRINAMSHLHELLYKQDNLTFVNAYEYFEMLSDEVKESYNKDVNIKFLINAQLEISQAIYCGLILNELITNSFKYAFPNGQGDINISLDSQDNQFILTISDNGIGYDKNQQSDSLGLVLVETLAIQQLKGQMNIDSTNGVKVQIKWSANE